MIRYRSESQVSSSPMGRSRASLGFSVIEIMVTLGILVLVAAGVASVFSSISDTINTGKRVSEINRFSAQLERVMRQDFENMTRDGYLVIANQYTNNSMGTLIDTQLSPDDRSDLNGNGAFGHPRRIDEIMFFARGEFETSRRAIASGMTAKSTEAAIYYGHGQKRRFDPDPIMLDLFFNPAITDTNYDPDARLGINAVGSPNPNQYASDWSLLRHVTLLVEPHSAGQVLPDEVFGVGRTNQFGNTRQWLEDSGRQVGLQPASRSIFGSLGWSEYKVATPPPVPAVYEVPKWYAQVAGVATDPQPQSLRSSGLVDVVTESLSSIRTILPAISADRRPFNYWPITAGNPGAVPVQGYEDFVAQFWEDDASDVDNLGPDKAVGLDLDSPGSNHVRFMRQWMIDSLPSLWSTSALGSPRPLSRVRYEDVPARLIFNESGNDPIYDDGGFAINTDDGDRARIYAEANQEMLGSSVFVPRCTEFVVEWSFGHTDFTITDPSDPRYKRVLWYGLERWIDSNNDGVIQPVGLGLTAGEDQRVATYYNRRPVNPDFDRGPDPQLILGHPATIGGFGPPPTLEVTTFGYPDLRGNEWPWPKFIRVTISLADPLDPTIERTFQMVFDIPDASQN